MSSDRLVVAGFSYADLEFTELSEYMDASSELGRETGTWMPLFTDVFAFSNPWSWMRPGATINFSYELPSPITFTTQGGGAPVLSSAWGEPISKSSSRIIEMDTRGAGSSFQSNGLNNDRDMSSMCIHATSPFEMMERVKFRVAVRAAALPESIAFSGPSSLVRVRFDASQEPRADNTLAYTMGRKHYALNDICEPVTVTSRPLSWHESWSDCQVDLASVNMYEEDTLAWDSLCFFVSPGVQIYIDQVAAELRDHSLPRQQQQQQQQQNGFQRQQQQQQQQSLRPERHRQNFHDEWLYFSQGLLPPLGGGIIL